MRVRLSDLVTEEAVADLREALDGGRFPGISVEHAILFLRADGILPASDLPAQSFLDLEDWIRARRG